MEVVLLSEQISPGKRATSWKVTDIAALAGIEEGVYLEFKKPSELIQNEKFARDKFTKELVETVSAFLNSDGGVILVGVQTDKHSRDRKIEFLKSLDTWAPDQTLEHLGISLTSSQIRDLIHGNIVPKPIGIEVKDLTVSVGNTTSTVFIITVASSPLGAHQSTKTLRYYRRTADGDEPMLDFDIRAVNSRRAGPLLYLACTVSDRTGAPLEEEWTNSSVNMKEVKSEDNRFYRIDLIFATSNFGRGTADIARFDIGIPIPWSVQRVYSDGIDAGSHWVEHSGLRYTLDRLVTVFWAPDKCREIPLPDKNKRLSEQQVSWLQVIYSGGESPSHPIWPTSGRRIIGRLRLDRQDNGSTQFFLWLPWRAFSVDMPETKGAVLLIEKSNTLYVYNYEMNDVDWWHHAGEEAEFEELKQRFQVS